MTAPYTVLRSPALATTYGVTAPGSSTTPVQLDPTKRTGLLTQIGFLSVQAHPVDTSPVLRGKTVRENFLCQTMPPPPPGVGPAPAVSPTLTTRQRFAVHESNPTCGACHLLMDPIGLSFEDFDWNGNYRATQNGLAIDIAGAINGTTDIDGAFSSPVNLGQKLGASGDVQSCVALQYLRYGAGRLESSDDLCVANDLATTLKAAKGNIPQYLTSVIKSASFSYLRVGNGGGT